MIAELALEVLQGLSYILKTRLPYPWDFCRLDFKPTVRLLLNSGSYFLVYAAFTCWFVRMVMKELRTMAGSRISTKDWIMAVVLSITTASQVLWPIFLLGFYFITCSYYPWSTALTVIILNLPVSISSLWAIGIKKSQEILQTVAERVSSLYLEDTPVGESPDMPVSHETSARATALSRTPSAEEMLPEESKTPQEILVPQKPKLSDLEPEPYEREHSEEETIPYKAKSAEEKNVPCKSKSSEEKTVPHESKSSEEKTVPYKSISLEEKTASYKIKPSEEKTVPFETKSSEKRIVPQESKSSDEKSVPHKNKSSEDETAAYKIKSSEEKIVPSKSKSSEEKTVPFKRKSSEEKTVPSKSKSSEEKTVPLKSKSSEEKTVPFETKSSEEKTIPYKSETADKKTYGSLEEKKSAEEKPTPYKRESSEEKPTPYKRESSEEKPTPYKRESSEEKTYPSKSETSKEKTAVEEKKSPSSAESRSVSGETYDATTTMESAPLFPVSKTSHRATKLKSEEPSRESFVLGPGQLEIKEIKEFRLGEFKSLKSSHFQQNLSKKISTGRFSAQNALEVKDIEYRPFGASSQFQQEKENAGSKTGRVLKTSTEVKDMPYRLETQEVSTVTSDHTIPGSSCHNEDKMGYCGHCWKHDYLPYRPGFSELRKPYNTRSGKIYGPPRRFLTIDEFVNQHGIN